MESVNSVQINKIEQFEIEAIYDRLGFTFGTNLKIEEAFQVQEQINSLMISKINQLVDKENSRTYKEKVYSFAPTVEM